MTKDDLLIAILAALAGVKELDVPSEWIRDDVKAAFSNDEKQKLLCKKLSVDWIVDLKTSLKIAVEKRMVCDVRSRTIKKLNFYQRTDVELPDKLIADLKAIKDWEERYGTRMDDGSKD